MSNILQVSVQACRVIYTLLAGLFIRCLQVFSITPYSMLHRDHTADPARRRLNQPTKLGFAWTEQIFRNSAKTFFFFLRPRSLTTSIWCLMVSFSWKQISIPANLLHMQPKFTYHVDASLWASEIIYMLLIVSSTSLCSTLHRLHFGSRKREIVDHRKIIMMKQRKC